MRSQLYRVKRPQRIESNQRPEVHHISNWKKSRPGADFAPHTSSSSLLNLHFFFLSLFQILQTIRKVISYNYKCPGRTKSKKRHFVRKRWCRKFGFRKFGTRTFSYVEEDICRGPFHLSTTASFPGACIVPHGQIVRQFMQTWWSFSKAISFLFWKMQSRQTNTYYSFSN